MERRVFSLTAEVKSLVTDRQNTARRTQSKKRLIVQHVFLHDGITKAGELEVLAGHSISA